MEIKFEIIRSTGVITLNRPQALNALNIDMAEQFSETLNKWSADKKIKRVLLKGEGKHFCAGGDVKKVHLSGNKSDLKKNFFSTEYKLNYEIYNFPKPYMSIWNGVVMGGGVGLSIYGDYRIVTDTTKFAMPETAIGFFPDVGGSYFLSRLKNNIGLLLGLTGYILNANEILSLELGTHYCPINELDNLIDEYISKGTINNFIKTPLDNSSILINTNLISECFNGNIQDILNKIKNSSLNDKLYQNIINKCPMSLFVTNELIKKGRKKSLKECLEMEFNLSQKMVYRNDFNQGIDAVLISKTHKPKWDPELLEDINLNEVESFFEENKNQLF
jgi:enoyl-CoA hydratase/carnithine racemase